MKMKLFGIIGLVSVIGMPAFADDFDEEEYEAEYAEDFEPDTEQRVVSTRMTCDAIKKRIAELQEEDDPELQSELDSLLLRQRSQCTVRGKRRPVRDYNNVNPVAEVDAETPEDFIDETPTVKPVVPPEPAPESKLPNPKDVPVEDMGAKIAENMAKGLCGDGAKPNKYGCCTGEKFKEVSQMKFACCPKSGDGECHEPIKKK